jgi:hypothetical protein
MSTSFVSSTRTRLKSASFNSLNKAVVVSTDDPLKQGRIKVLVKGVSSTELYAYPIVLGTQLFVPEVGSTVLVYMDEETPGLIYYLGVILSRDEQNKYPDRVHMYANYPELSETSDGKYEQECYHILRKTPFVSEYWKCNSISSLVKSDSTLSLKKDTEVDRKDIKVTRIRKVRETLSSSNSRAEFKQEIMIPADQTSKATDVINVDSGVSNRNITITNGINNITIKASADEGVVDISLQGRTLIRCSADGTILIYGTTGVVVQGGASLSQAATTVRCSSDGSLTIQSNGSVSIQSNGPVSVQSADSVTVQSAGTIQLLGGGKGSGGGVVTSECLCAYTRRPHHDFSSNVIASK